jgi:hypothetical protein
MGFLFLCLFYFLFVILEKLVTVPTRAPGEAGVGFARGLTPAECSANVPRNWTLRKGLYIGDQEMGDKMRNE